MFDLKWIRENAVAFDAGCAKRGLPPMAGEILELDARARSLQTGLQEMQKRRNDASHEIGAVKVRGEDASALIAEVTGLKDKIREAEEAERAARSELENLLVGVPNIADDSVPPGEDETANVELRRWGEPRGFDFTPKEHFDIGEGLGLMDFERAARISGARFVVLSGTLARLERALAQFMLDMHTREFDYTEVNPPLLVRDQAAFGTGNLPKFEDDLFETSHREVITADEVDVVNPEANRAEVRPKDPNDQNLARKIANAVEHKAVFGKAGFKRLELTTPLWLIPTAEMSLTNLVAGEIVDEARLPIRVTAFTPCFRAEAGAAGKDTRGMMRQHQFTKVELVSISHPDHSEEELERMTTCAEEVLRRLGLPYRVVLLCGGDMSFAARKTYDIEVWLPGQGRYREISSCSNCGDFQARRMKARFRPTGERQTRYVHTLNGSGLAVGRTLVAVLENYQQEGGSVMVPPALTPYMDGLERLTPLA
ncbi:MAG: serine--tRNA ligase [Alphaproteobacteria bacterium]